MLNVDVVSLEDLSDISDSLLGVGGGASTIGVAISELRKGASLSVNPTLSGGVVGVLEGRTGRTGRSSTLALGVSVVGVSKSSYASSTEGSRGRDFENDSMRSWLRFSS